MHQRSGEIPGGWDQVPLSVIWGARDSWVPIDAIEPWIEAHPDLIAFDTIAEAAHNPMDTHPEAFERALIRQIESLD